MKTPPAIWTFPFLLMIAVTTVGAWGEKGHVMTARVAVRNLPPDMPEFFRKSEVELGYLCPEPDRWRNFRREPALFALHTYDHGVRTEWLPPSLPPNRYEYVLLFAGKPKPGGGVHDHTSMGFAPYAIAERLEMLTVNFMLWRKAAETTADERRIKRQIEQNIIHIAGLLGHFVTDNGMPLHTSIHSAGWNRIQPNPKEYAVTKSAATSIHSRFETDFVRTIEEREFEPLLAAPRTRGGPWLEEGLAHIRKSNEYVETVFALDKATPFGSGKESPEARRFTCERLAFSAEALRDFWYSAWVRSATLP